MTQRAPYPHVLAQLLRQVSYKPPGRRWTLTLEDTDRGQGSKGLTLIINIQGPDAYNPDHLVSVDHYMLVPPAAYNVRSWRRWLFDQISLVEQHERMEFFQVDGQPVYPPAHGPGNDPYLILDYGTDLDRRTAYTGRVNPE